MRKDRVLQRLIRALWFIVMTLAAAVVLTCKWILDAYGWGGWAAMLAASMAAACLIDWIGRLLGVEV